jgi:hypothetical protein
MGKLTPLLRSDEAKRLYTEIQHTYEANRTIIDREIQLRR